MATALRIGSMIDVDTSLPDTVAQLRRYKEAGLAHTFASRSWARPRSPCWPPRRAGARDRPGHRRGAGAPAAPDDAGGAGPHGAVGDGQPSSARDRAVPPGGGGGHLGHELRQAGPLHEGVPQLAHATTAGRGGQEHRGARHHQRLRTPWDTRRRGAAGPGRRPRPHHAQAGGHGRRRDRDLDDRYRDRRASRRPSPPRRRRPATRRPRRGVPAGGGDRRPEAARERINEALSIYPNLPSYRAMLDKEGAESPADIAFVGDEEAVAAAVAQLAEAGATDFVAAIVGDRWDQARLHAARPRSPALSGGGPPAPPVTGWPCRPAPGLVSTPVSCA